MMNSNRQSGTQGHFGNHNSDAHHTTTLHGQRRDRMISHTLALNGPGECNTFNFCSDNVPIQEGQHDLATSFVLRPETQREPDHEEALLTTDIVDADSDLSIAQISEGQFGDRSSEVTGSSRQFQTAESPCSAVHLGQSEPLQSADLFGATGGSCKGIRASGAVGGENPTTCAPLCRYNTRENENQVSQENKNVPTEPSFATYESRFFSFANWPMAQQPRALARAGLYYAGTGDVVYCFFCGMDLKEWQPHDNPFQEHKRFSPDCPFIQTLYKQQPKLFQMHEHGQQVPSSSHQDVTGNQTTVKQHTQDTIDITEVYQKQKPLFDRMIQMGYTMDELHNAYKRFGQECLAGGEVFVDCLIKLHEHESLSVNDLPQSRTGGSGNVSVISKETQTDFSHILQPYELCKLCKAHRVELTLLPCLHLASCRGCAGNLLFCPACFETVEDTVLKDCRKLC